MKKRIIIGISILLGVFLLIFIGGGAYMCQYALLPEEHGQQLAEDRVKIKKRYPGVLEWYDSLYNAGLFRDTVIVGEGGYRLHAVYSVATSAGPATSASTTTSAGPAASASTPAGPVTTHARGSVVLVHGYTDNHLCFLTIARMYRDSLNFNVLIPDLHYHGKSEGRAIQMGWLDRLDALRFAELAHNLWQEDTVLVHGVSMGAATTMMLSGEPNLPEYIRGFIEDCGYTSVWDQFAYNLKQEFNLPPFPILYGADLMCRLRFGWSFKEASCVKQVAKSTRPMLFIHGDADDYVPYEFLDKLYEAKTQGYKEKWVTSGTKHAKSHLDYPAQYVEKINNFVENFD